MDLNFINEYINLFRRTNFYISGSDITNRSTANRKLTLYSISSMREDTINFDILPSTLFCNYNDLEDLSYEEDYEDLIIYVVRDSGYGHFLEYCLKKELSLVYINEIQENDPRINAVRIKEINYERTIDKD